MCDNLTVIDYINSKGGMKSETRNNITCKLQNFCIENKLWVSAAHIAGKNNEADQQHRILQNATERKLHPELFHKIVDKFGKPDIDLFASSINRVATDFFLIKKRILKKIFRLISRSFSKKMENFKEKQKILEELQEFFFSQYQELVLLIKYLITNQWLIEANNSKM